MTIRLSSRHFSGGAKLYDGTLANAIRELAQYQCATTAKALADITDNSTGTSGGDTIAAIAIPAAFTSAGTDTAPKAGTETALGTVKNAITTLLNSAKTIGDAISVQTVTISTGGTNGSGTIAAMTKSVTAVAGSGAAGIAYDTGSLYMIALRTYLSEVVAYVNEIATAVALTPITDSSGGSASKSRTFAALGTDTGTAATAPEAAALGTMSKAAVDTYLTAVAGVIATCAAKLNEATNGSRTLVPTVVAL